MELEKALLLDSLAGYDCIIIHGGDGAFRRHTKALLERFETLPAIFFDAIGSFNVVAKLHKIPTLQHFLSHLAATNELKCKTIPYYTINNEIFIFSAGNSFDLLHIEASEQLRTTALGKKGFKYFASGLLLAPFHIVALGFLLSDKSRFFLFAPNSRWSFKNHFGLTKDKLTITTTNYPNIVELDGDIVALKEQTITIEKSDRLIHLAV